MVKGGIGARKVVAAMNVRPCVNTPPALADGVVTYICKNGLCPRYHENK